MIRKDNLKNILVVSQNEKKLLSSRLINLRNTTWISEKPKENIQYKARFRHRGKFIPVKIGIKNSGYTLNMIELERAITPGQSIVFYNDNERLLGGGIIETNE